MPSEYTTAPIQILRYYRYCRKIFKLSPNRLPIVQAYIYRWPNQLVSWSRGTLTELIKLDETNAEHYSRKIIYIKAN